MVDNNKNICEILFQPFFLLFLAKEKYTVKAFTFNRRIIFIKYKYFEIKIVLLINHTSPLGNVHIIFNMNCIS